MNACTKDYLIIKLLHCMTFLFADYKYEIDLKSFSLTEKVRRPCFKLQK